MMLKMSGFHSIPIQLKQLTDEEIFDVAGEFPFIENGTERLNFTRAILRKAQEK